MNEKEKQLAEIKRLQNEIEGNKKGMNIMLLLGVISVGVICISWINSMTFLLFVGFLTLFISILVYSLCQKGLKQFESALSRASVDFDKYMKMEEFNRELRQIEKSRQTELARNIEHPGCPMCKSRKTKRITTANRAASIYLVGAASSKIGKQYECLSCKYKW